jgi:hypothetical protein
MDSVRIIQHKGKEVLILDYSGCLGARMIERFDKAKAIVLSEGRSFPVLSVFNEKTFVSPEFMRHVERNLPELEALISKQAIVGLSTVQGWILKGVNLWYKRQIHQFDTVDAALDYLIGN